MSRYKTDILRNHISSDIIRVPRNKTIMKRKTVRQRCSLDGHSFHTVSYSSQVHSSQVKREGEGVWRGCGRTGTGGLLEEWAGLRRQCQQVLRGGVANPAKARWVSPANPPHLPLLLDTTHTKAALGSRYIPKKDS